MKIALLFSGQGAQTVGMGEDLNHVSGEARMIYEEADRLLGRGLSALIFKGPDAELTRTANCQPALFVHGLACLAVLKTKLPDLVIQGAAGLSLGEFTAHVAAGTMDFATGLAALERRGAFMDDACRDTAGGMAAMIGGDENGCRELAAKHDIDVANLNCPGQIVLSGSVAGIDAAVADARNHGVRMAKKLNVAGAYHSRLMRSAEARLAPVIAASGLRLPSIPVPSNFLGQPASDVEALRDSLVRQVTGTVRWEACIRWFLEQGVTLFIELGPGGALTGMINRIERGVKSIPAGDLPGIEAAATAVREGLN